MFSSCDFVAFNTRTKIIELFFIIYFIILLVSYYRSAYAGIAKTHYHWAGFIVSMCLSNRVDMKHFSAIAFAVAIAIAIAINVSRHKIRELHLPFTMCISLFRFCQTCFVIVLLGPDFCGWALRAVAPRAGRADSFGDFAHKAVPN